MKSKEVSVLVIASLILLPFLGGDSFAQSNQVLTVTTEKESYAAGEPVEVLGLVDIILEGTPVVIRVVSPVGNMIHPAQVDVESDGSFSETISTSIGGKWKETGTYTIMMNYGDNSTQVEFEYGGGVPGFRSHARYFPDLDVALALSANMIPIDPDVGNIADEISNIVINHLKEIGLDLPEPNNADSDLPPVESTNTGEIR